MTEDQLEQKTLGWLSELGYAVHSVYDIAHDGPPRSGPATARWCWLAYQLSFDRQGQTAAPPCFDFALPPTETYSCPMNP